MATEYVETVEDDNAMTVEAIAVITSDARPWLVLSAFNEGDGIGMQVQTGGGVRDAAMVRKMLKMALQAIPE